MRGVTVAAVAAHAAGKISEDSWGHIGDENFGAAWVLDGATGLGDRNYITGAYSDAAWYAQEFSKALHQHSLWPVPAEEVFSTAIRQVAKLWYDTVGSENVPRYALPSAAGIWVRWKDDVIEYCSLGDCRGWHVADGVLTQLGLLDEDPNDDWVADHVSRNQAAGVTPENMRGAIMDHLRAARGELNKPGGYWIFSIHEETVHHLNVQQIKLTDGHIILCSDGLFRWVDVYCQGGAADFAAGCIADMYGVLSRVREIENADRDCRNFPRLKYQDDATGIVLSSKH